MNIKQAKQEITNTLRAYLTRDDLGNYLIPTVRQRPVLLMGPPGIGKTQIMEQIAAETGVGLVAYTITHHTRQSAIGLPFIEKRTYGGETYSVTEYTMSEILGSVYELMERTGLKEGILFLDEINCVSETLAPMMLQFLQCKTFGNQKLPEGWLIVAAGNPPEYNKSVRDFDVVTLDRVKRIDVEEDYGVWKEYARRKNLHGAILSYLDIKKDNFYRIENTADGLQFATARGCTRMRPWASGRTGRWWGSTSRCPALPRTSPITWRCSTSIKRPTTWRGSSAAPGRTSPCWSCGRRPLMRSSPSWGWCCPGSARKPGTPAARTP